MPHACTGSIGEEQFVLRQFFGDARGGTFIELGANNGVASNVVHLADCLGWTGLLIEGSPPTFEELRKRRPAALSLGTAICARHGCGQTSRCRATAPLPACRRR